MAPLRYSVSFARFSVFGCQPAPPQRRILGSGASRYGRHKYFRPHQEPRRLLTFGPSKVSKYLRTPPIFHFVLCILLLLGPPHRTRRYVYGMYRAKCHRGSMAFASCCVCHLALRCLLSKCHSALFIFPGRATPHPTDCHGIRHSAIYANHSGEFLSLANCKPQQLQSFKRLH